MFSVVGAEIYILSDSLHVFHSHPPQHISFDNGHYDSCKVISHYSVVCIGKFHRFS